MGHPPVSPVPRSLAWATDLDVLALDRVIEAREGYLVVRSPANPGYYWGNLLLFDEAPAPGDARRWERLFAAEFADHPGVRHHTFGWDRSDGALGRAHEDFVARGYELEENVGLIADAGGLRTHPRQNRDVVIRALDPAAGADQPQWDGVLDLHLANRDPRFEAAQHREFSRRYLESRRTLLRAGRGGWYVAQYPGSDEVVASCGIIVTGDRGRFQTVDTAAAYRRRGICSRLVVEAAAHAARTYGARRLVIVAESGYHALGLYESLGFQRAERVCGVCRWPAEDLAAG
jgi:ribosomal protein S18 acetylase RimI-like enzyme